MKGGGKLDFYFMSEFGSFFGDKVGEVVPGGGKGFRDVIAKVMEISNGGRSDTVSETGFDDLIDRVEQKWGCE